MYQFILIHIDIKSVFTLMYNISYFKFKWDISNDMCRRNHVTYTQKSFTVDNSSNGALCFFLTNMQCKEIESTADVSGSGTI